MKRWYLLHAKPRKEGFLWGEIQVRQIDGFYPQIKVQAINPRARKIKPYFPGYLFVHIDPENGDSEVRWLPGSNGLVRFGGEPASVPDSVVNAIRQHLDTLNAAGGELLGQIRPGELVDITGGPFAGCEAIFDARLPGSERVRVLLKMVQSRLVPLELSAGALQPKNHR